MESWKILATHCLVKRGQASCSRILIKLQMPTHLRSLNLFTKPSSKKFKDFPFRLYLKKTFWPIENRDKLISLQGSFNSERLDEKNSVVDDTNEDELKKVCEIYIAFAGLMSICQVFLFRIGCRGFFISNLCVKGFITMSDLQGFKWRFFCRVDKSRNSNSQVFWPKGHDCDPLPKCSSHPKGFWSRSRTNNGWGVVIFSNLGQISTFLFLGYK